MKLTIEQADNGYVLSYSEITEHSGLVETRYIAVEDTDYKEDCVSGARLTQKLLFKIMEHYNLFGSKHDAERCYVVIKNQNGDEIE